MCPELIDISEDELKYIILAYDYIESPFRKKPLDERKRIAKRKVWKNSRKNPETQKVTKAIDAYKGLIYDSKREAVENYRQKVANLNREISISNDLNEIKQKVSLIEFF